MRVIAFGMLVIVQVVLSPLQASHNELNALDANTTTKIDIRSPHLLHTAANIKFRLNVLFYKDMVPGDIPADNEATDYVIVSDEKTGSEVRYKPIDEPSIVQQNGFFRTVWSSSSSYLLLPLGTNDGFCILLVNKKILRQIKERRCNDFVRVQRLSREPLWHKFIEWKGEDSFHFQVGDDKHQMEFVYKLKSRSLLPVGGISQEVMGQNSKGLIVFEI